MAKQIQVQCVCDSHNWSATTACIKCGAQWLWGVQDNKNFTCPDCQPKRITREEFENHDCHLRAEDSCAVCIAWAEQQETDTRKVDESLNSIGLGY